MGGAGRSVGLPLSRITSWTTYLASSLYGPSLPLAIPLLSRQSTSQRLVTTYTRSPSLVGEESRPRLSQSLTLPEASLGTTSCQSSSPVFSSKHIRMLRSPTCRGSRGFSLLVPIDRKSTRL